MPFTKQHTGRGRQTVVVNKVGRSLAFNAQSTVWVMAEHNSSNLNAKSLYSSRHFAVFVWRGFGEDEVE